MAHRLSLITTAFLEKYSASCNVNWQAVSRNMKNRAEYSAADFNFYIIASSVFSSKIEGNSLDLNSFMNNRDKKIIAKKKEFKEIEDLVDAYDFAAGTKLTESGFLTAHKMLSQTLLGAKERGKYRRSQVGVFDNNTGRPVYLAVEPEFVAQETAKLFSDIDILVNRRLTTKEIFYHAAMIHLWVAMIHPFSDGNGRIARLAEKWFLAAKFGASAWSVNSEKYYWDHRAEYYRNISLGYNYYALKWERCIPFLQMLPDAL